MNDLPNSISRRRFLQLSGGTALLSGLGIASVGALAGCASSDSSTPTGSGSVPPSGQATGTLKVLGTATYKVDANNPPGVDVQYGFAGGNEDIISKTAQAGAFDLVSAFHGAIDQLDHLNRLQPIDTSLISDWDTMTDSFRNSTSIRRNDQIVAVPHHWGYTYNVYNKDKTESPETFEALMAPALTQKIITPDDAYAVIGTFAAFSGAKQYNLLSQDEFDRAIAMLMQFKPQVLTVHPYGEEGQIFGRGDAWVGVAESANTVLLAKEAGVNAAFNMFGSWSWFECYMLLQGATNPTAAYAYISQSLTEEAMVASVKKSQAFPVIDSKAALDAIDPIFRYESADEVLAKAPLQPGVPLASGNGVVGWPEWQKAWQQFKS